MAATLSLPPAAAIDQAATEMVAAQVGNSSAIKRINKAQYNLRLGNLPIMLVADGFLMPSGTRAGVIHKIAFTGECSCEASGRCWHQTAIALVEQAQRYTLPAAPRKASRAEYERALSEMNELY
jgi:hypothetical protein